jgi:ferritin-like metal-binding protein YciE
MGFFTKDIKTLNDLFVHTLQDIYYAEQQIAKNLPDMIEKASDQSLKNGFETHLAETKNQIVRLEKVFKMHGVEAKGVNCPAIDGILEEASDVAGDVDDRTVLDAALIAAAQARALRDHAVRLADRMGQEARSRRLRVRSPREPR